jgi:transcriptional regulator with XRE-family HTH domain
LAARSQIKTLRAHKVAALMVDARLYARRTPEEACALLGWETQHLSDLEAAVLPPTLPELEALAAIYAVPVDHFFGNKSLSDEMPRLRVETMRQRLELRNRILGAMIMQARTRRNFSRDDLSMATGLTIEQITDYELGQAAIPVTDLEDITKMLQIDINDWIDSYAIPTRDINFKPFKIPEAPHIQDLPVVEEKSSAPNVTPVASIPEPEAAPVPSIPSPAQHVEPASNGESGTMENKSESISQPQTATRDLKLESDEMLTPELIDFINNPVNRQYLLLASNLSHMPADQLRRIAESLLEITF